MWQGDSNTTVLAQEDSSSSRNKTPGAFGEDEAKIFFEDWKSSDEGSKANNDLDNNEIIEIQKEESKLELPTAFLIYQSRLKTENVVFVQRDQRHFGKYYFARSLSVKSVFEKVFCRRDTRSLRGPSREFLTLCMWKFPDLGFIVFGSIKSLYLTRNAETVLAQIYCKLER